MSLKLPDDKIVYNLPEQVGINAKNIKYLAERYKEIDSIPAEFATMKAYFDDVMTPAFSTWTTTFEGWTDTLDTYLTNMSSAAVGAIAGQNIAPRTVSQTNPNISISFNFAQSNPNIDITNVYNRLEVINKILYVIANIRLENNSGSDVSYNSWPSVNVNLSSYPEIADNIYDINGNQIGLGGGQAFVAGQRAVCIKGTSPSANNFGSTKQNILLGLFNTDSPGNRTLKFQFFIEQDASITIPAGEKIYMSTRIALTLL